MFRICSILISYIGWFPCSIVLPAHNLHLSLRYFVYLNHACASLFFSSWLCSFNSQLLQVNRLNYLPYMVTVSCFYVCMDLYCFNSFTDPFYAFWEVKPYVQYVGFTSAYIMWQSSKFMEISVTVSGKLVLTSLNSVC